MWWTLLLACTGETTPKVDACAICDGGCLEETIPSEPASHVTGGVDYTDTPPTGGDHDPCWAAWGVHDEPVPDESWVHNLEHGGVVFLYRCPEGCAEDVADLAAHIEALGPTALLTEYDQMAYSFGAVAWEHRLQLDCYDWGTLEAFYEAHVDQGPESSTASPSSGCMDTGA